MSSDTTTAVSLLAKLNAGEISSARDCAAVTGPVGSAEATERLRASRSGASAGSSPCDLMPVVKRARWSADWRAFRWRSRTFSAWKESRPHAGAACCADFARRMTPR